jgi:RNA recognition motif. (a.k.a. RRM, RBD, or RNP domain)
MEWTAQGHFCIARGMLFHSSVLAVTNKLSFSCSIVYVAFRRWYDVIRQRTFFRESEMQQEGRNQDNTIYVGNIDERVTEPLLWELFLQVCPVVNVHLPKDRVTQQHQGFGFVEFLTSDDAYYG